MDEREEIIKSGKRLNTMGMPLELQTMLITKGKEKRVKENSFVIEKEGYRLYPLHIPIEIKREKQSDPSGTAIIDSLTWENHKTILSYRLVSLYSTN